jgi:hypothetical protein
MQSRPDFYLASKEGYGLDQVRSCWRVKQLKIDQGAEAILVRAEPPVLGERNPIAEGRDRHLVVVTPRHQGVTLTPIRQWPFFVAVLFPLVESVATHEVLSKEEFRVIAWGELYESEADAVQAVRGGA